MLDAELSCSYTPDASVLRHLISMSSKMFSEDVGREKSTTDYFVKIVKNF